MVNPLARVNMRNNLNDKDYEDINTNNKVLNLDSKESELIQKIIQGGGKSKTITLEEAVKMIKNSH